MMSIQEVAQELRVSEKTVRRMLWRGELQGIRVGGQWRFPIEHLAGLLPATIAGARTHARSPVAPIHDLIGFGGIHYRIAGETPHEVLMEAVRGIPCVPPAARPALFKAIWERESLCSTGIGNGIAVPHPIVPMWVHRSDIPSSIGLFFLERPVDFGSLDGEKVKILFLLLLETLQEHLQAMARLVRLLHDEPLAAFLKDIPLRAEIFPEFARAEKALLPGDP
jgi:PTS system nitrogen regulatory IIA component